MGTGTTMVGWLALLMLGQAAPGGELLYMGQRDFKIPIIQSDPAQRANIEQLFLYVSTDEGKTWQQVAVASPDQQAFPYFAQKDGLYWFNVSIMDKQKRTDPPDVAAVPPGLKVIVDTRKPLVKLHSPERQAEQASISWEIHDENPDLASFRLEYKTAEAPTWYTVAVSPPTATGQKRWGVSTPGPIMVRLQVQDAAGNAGVAHAELPAEGHGPMTLTTSFAPAPASAVRAPAAPAGDSPFPAHNWERANRPPAAAAPAAPAEREPPRPPLAMEPSPVPPPPPPVDAGPRPIGRGAQALNGQLSNSPGNAALSQQPRTPIPGLQFANNTHVQLNYEVSKVGPSGLGVVELWRTQDDGRTWQRFAEDSDLKPPFDVELPGEGRYAFTLIVRSRNKLGKRAPSAGEGPDLRLEVDTTPPAAALLEPQGDPRRRDQVVLLWQATDANLTSNPVTLQWSTQAGGPWQTIAADVPNTGKYIWQMPPNLPYEVFLRLEVRDLAGNVGVDDTPEPVLVDLTEPEAKLTGIVASPAKR